ncbi:peptidylprolyl isomerase [Labilibacter sediminis]|nr:peptidylprolyl isomerase [Labilibacter sediminis]
MNKRSVLWAIALMMVMVGCAQKSTEPVVLIKTDMGNIRLKLYNETPAHRDNFIKLAEEGFLDSTLFHRVIKGFMIQGGDPDSKHAEAGQPLGSGGPGYTLPAEINYPKYFHKKGALAAARQGDNVNPERRSSGSQFYIVQGEMIDEKKIAQIENRAKDAKRRAIFNQLLDEYNDSLNLLQSKGDQAGLMQLQQKIMARVNQEAEQNDEDLIPDDIKEVYASIGGTPQLDGSYTVFGEVINEKNWIETVKSWFGAKYGLDVVEAIAFVKTDGRDRPLKDIEIEVKVIKK